MPRSVSFSIILLLVIFEAGAQNLNTDTLFVSQAAEEAIDQYKNALGVQAHIYNGSEYIEYRSQGDEHPYLYDDWNYGSVVYANVRYERIPLFYDLAYDELITNYTHGKKIQLLRQHVSSFEIEGRTFVMLSNAQVSEGYYELLYDGKMKFYVHRLKVATTKINGNDAEAAFEERVKYYVFNNGKYHAVKSKGSVLALFGDRKKEIAKFARENGIKFAPREKSVPAMIAYFEKGV
jgi:hypothetical protein